jgi:hypothetical protein
VTGGERGAFSGPDGHYSNGLLSSAKSRAYDGFENQNRQIFLSASACTCDGLNQIQIIIGSKHAISTLMRRDELGEGHGAEVFFDAAGADGDVVGFGVAGPTMSM